MPEKNEPFFNSYKSVNGNPVLVLSLSQKENINVDIKSRFKNSLPKACPLSYYISEINFNNGSSVNRTMTSSFISIISNGIFIVKKQN